MAIYPAPALILVPALILNLAVAVFGAYRRRGEAPLGASQPVAAIASLVVLCAVGVVLVAGWDREWPILIGLVLGVVNALLWTWAYPASARESAGPIGSGIASVAVLALVKSDPTMFANELLGLLLGWASLGVIGRLSSEKAPPVTGALGLVTTAVAASAAAWGEKLFIGKSLGAPLAVALATLLAVGLALGEWLGGERNGRVTAIATAIYCLGALGVVGGLYGQPIGLVVAVLAGAALGAMAPLFDTQTGKLGGMGPLVLLVLGGALLVLDNRLMGVVAMGLGGIGLAVGARAGASARATLSLLVAIFAARVWMQLFLDRTLLTAYGIDLTHPYAFAALIVGGLMPLAAVLVARLCRPDRWLSTAWGLVVVLAPAWIGYFIHVEALGSLLAGLTAAAFVLGGAESAPDSPRAEARALMPALLTAATATTLLAAPWLVNVMNATRNERVVVLLLGLLVIAVGAGYWWVRYGRRPLATA